MVNLLESINVQTNMPLDSRTVVKALSNRDAISTTVRYLGMKVYVSDEKKEYRLEDGIENSHWKEIKGVTNLSEMVSDNNHMTVSQTEKDKWDGKAEGDHNHDLAYATKTHKHNASEVTGLPTALKNPTALTIQLNGKNDVVYDGSAVKSVNITPAGIGAQPSGNYAQAIHTHVATEITQDATHRMVSDTQISSWNSKSEAGHTHDSVYSKLGHSHAWGEITGKPETFAPSTHKHDDLYYTEAEVDTKIKDLDTKIENSRIKKYGVKFSGSNPVGVRTYDAVGMVANVGVDDQIVQNDFDKVSFYNRPVCCGHHDTNGNFIVHAYEGEPGFKRDGTNGEVYYECTPFYWNGSYEEPVVAADKFEGSILAPMFKTADEKVYLPCYWAATVGGKYVSRSGLYPTWSSVNGHMATCRNTNAHAHTETIKAHMSEYVLQLVEFATKDLQTIMMGSCNHIWENENYVTTIATTNKTYVIMAKDKASAYVVGQTIVTSSNWSSQRTITRIVDYDSTNSAIYFDNQPVISCAKGAKVSTFSYKTGATDNVKASSGSNVSNTDGKHQCKWRGKEAPWADSFSGLCDILRVIEGGKHYPYYLPDPKKYNNGTLTSDYMKLGYEVPATGGYAKTLGVNKHYPFAAITNQIGADSATYLSAYYWTSTNPTTVAFVGGSWNVGRDCSPVSFNLNAAPSYSYVSGLARLFVTPV